MTNGNWNKGRLSTGRDHYYIFIPKLVQWYTIIDLWRFSCWHQLDILLLLSKTNQKIPTFHLQALSSALFLCQPFYREDWVYFFMSCIKDTALSSTTLKGLFDSHLKSSAPAADRSVRAWWIAKKVVKQVRMMDETK